MIRKLTFAVAAAGLASAPVAASLTREAAPVSGESELGGLGTPFFLAGIAIVALAIVFLPEDQPTSP